LNWAGKHDGYALIRDEETGAPVQVLYEEVQPRLLIEAGRYGDEEADNILISGENLYALKTLVKSGYAGQIKCIYIDPPFNTGQAFEHYDDALEHSLWLTMMRDRIDLLHDLLHEEGAIFIHIDDTHLANLIILTDEIFGRENRVSIVTFKQGSATGHKAINPGVVNTSNFIVVYAKDKSQWKFNRVFTGRERDKRYGQFIVNLNQPYDQWQFTTLSKAFAASLGLPEKKAKKVEDYETKLDDFVLHNANNVVQLARPDYEGVSAEARKLIDQSKDRPNKIMCLQREKYSDIYLVGGQRILFYSDKLKLIDGQYIAGEPLTSIWSDILSNNLHTEGGVDFPKGKKPEGLVKRILELATSEGDCTLDCFAGSGTTGAVAHKMNRRWVLVEANKQSSTHILPRLQSVVAGTDNTGITKAMNWQGGGGFRSYTLGKSLIERDAETGVWRLSYTNGRLIEAVCLQEGFKLLGRGIRHGVRGRHYAHITDCIVTQPYVDALASELDEDEALTIYCMKAKRKLSLPDGLQLKHIPRDLLPTTNGARGPKRDRQIA